MKRLETLRQVFTHALKEAQTNQAYYYNLRHRDKEFEIGDVVLWKSHPLSSAIKRYSAALVKPFEGPYVITHKESRTRYELSDFAGKSKGETSIQDLKRYLPPLGNNEFRFRSQRHS